MRRLACAGLLAAALCACPAHRSASETTEAGAPAAVEPDAGSLSTAPAKDAPAPPPAPKAPAGIPAPPRTTSQPGPKPPDPPRADPDAPNLRVEVYEIVESPEKEAFSATRVLIAGREAGVTPADRKSRRKVWVGRVPRGNHPMRFERWIFDRVGDWTKAADAWQPRERFIRVREGHRTRVMIRYYYGGKKYVYRISREKIK